MTICNIYYFIYFFPTLSPKKNKVKNILQIFNLDELGDQVMNPKEFVAKIIVRPIKSRQRFVRKYPSIRWMLSPSGILSLLSLVSTNFFASAQKLNDEPQQQQIADQLYESLNIARAKVEAATSLGVIGNGVPDIYGISMQELLMAFIITAIGSILTYMAFKTLLKYADKIKMSRTTISPYTT